MTPLKRSNTIAARMGRWSASHRKTAILGWLAFVVAAAVIGGAVGMQKLDQDELGIGESGRAQEIVERGRLPRLRRRERLRRERLGDGVRSGLPRRASPT